MERKGDFITNIRYKKETEIVTFQGKEITLENLSPVFTPEQEAVKRWELGPIADFTLLETAVAAAREMGVEMPVGNVLSSDTFYDASGSTMKWGEMGVLAVDRKSVV